MAQLFTRQGVEFTGAVETNEAGKPVRLVNVACDRCHVVGGQRLWIMGMENGRPYSKTGFDCWTCSNTGIRKTVKERLYTETELARANKAAATREATRAAKTAAAAAQAAAKRAGREAAYRAQHADFLAKIATLCTGNGSDFWDRMAADLLLAFRSPSERQIALVEAEIAKRQQNASSGFVGAVGDKITLTITVERIVGFKTVFGNQYIYICRTDSGDVVTYKGAAHIGGTGDTITVTAAVKEHTVYNGVKQTVIQRPKVLEAA